MIVQLIDDKDDPFQDFGLSELEKSAFSNGLRAPLSALFLLGYHTYAAHIFGRISY